MKFTAVIPVMRMETRTYDVDISENAKKVIKAYEKGCDDMSKENEANLIDAIKANDPSFDERIDNFEDYANVVIDDVSWKIYRKEVDSGNEGVDEIDDVHGLADGNFNFIGCGGRGDFTPRPLLCAAGYKIYKMSSLNFVILAARLGASLGREFSENSPLHLFIFRIFRHLYGQNSRSESPPHREPAAVPRTNSIWLRASFRKEIERLPLDIY